MNPLRVAGVTKKKKTLTGVLKRFSIAELKILNRTEAKDLKDAVEQVLLAKKIRQKVLDNYEKL